MDILSSIGNYGFPMALSVYLLVRMENKLEALTASLTELTRVLQNKL